MPVSPTGEAVVTHSHSWSFLVDQDSDECSHAVALLLNRATDAPSGYDYGRHAAALAEVITDQNSQTNALQIAKSGPRQAIYKHLASNCGFEVSMCVCSFGRLYAALADLKPSH